MAIFGIYVTLPETNIAPKNGWLEYNFSIGKAYFQVRNVSFREGRFLGCTQKKRGHISHRRKFGKSSTQERLWLGIWGCDPFPGRNSVYVFYFQGGSIYTNQYHQITPKVLTNTHVFLETLHYPSRMILDLCRNLLVALFIFHGYGCMGIFQILRWAPTTRFEAPKKFPLSNRIFFVFPERKSDSDFLLCIFPPKMAKKRFDSFFLHRRNDLRVFFFSRGVACSSYFQLCKGPIECSR